MQTKTPCTDYIETKGLIYFARMLDKIRLKAAGKLPPEYFTGVEDPTHFDARCARFLGVNYAELAERTLQGGSDEEILQWCFAHGRRPSDEAGGSGMSIHVIGVATLALVFIVGTLRPVNIGALSLVATFLIGTLVVHESPEKILSGFPPDLFVLLVGVTYLFGLAAANGTIEWLIDRAVRLLGDRPLLVPWLIFFFSAVTSDMPSTRRRWPPLFFVSMWLPVALRCSTLPLRVIRKRLVVAL